jgi:hypothetical protein
MEESILPQSVAQTSATDTILPLSDTATEPPSLPDKCQLQLDAMRGAMADCKAAMKRFGTCQEAWFRCRFGIDLKQVRTGSTASGYEVAIALNSGVGMMGIGLSRLEAATGIKIE